MKSVVKLVKSVHAESQVLSAMFLGYVVLLIVSATFILKSHQGTEANTVTATSNTSSATQASN